LALAQTNYVIHLIKQKYHDAEFSLHSITTIADKDRVSEFHQFGIVGVFSTEHEQQLTSHEVDIVVHSLKDLPTNLAEGLVLAAVPERKDARDILCGTTLADLKQGATVGTGSLRRKAQILSLRPDVNVVPIRGNIGPRLARIQGEDGLDAVILAHAGLQRLNMGTDKAEVMAPELFPYAVGQGALGIEVYGQRDDVHAALAPLGHLPSLLAVSAERTVSRIMGGSCSMPLAAFAVWHGETLSLRAAWGDPDGKVPLIRSEGAAAVHAVADAVRLGETVARELQARVGSGQ
jgi:hydroxymethylbilane synthase